MESKERGAIAIAGALKRTENQPRLGAETFENSWDNYDDSQHEFSDAYSDTHLA